MSVTKGIPIGDPAREAIDSLRGYIYQIYQSALAWTEIKDDEFLFLEVAEDFAVAAADALRAVQVKETTGRVTINSDDIVASIDSFVKLQERNQSLKVTLHHLTTSTIGKEKSPEHRIGECPTLNMWRKLANKGELSGLRRILVNSKLSEKTKNFIASLDDTCFREEFLKRIHFDCGAPDSRFIERQLSSRVSRLVIERGGSHSQAESCTAKLLIYLLKLTTNKNRDVRFVDSACLEEHLEKATHFTVSKAQFEALPQLLEKVLSNSLPESTGLLVTQNIRPNPVSDVPLPKALASRSIYIKELLRSVDHSGICWISGGAGMGKTVAAKILARKTAGDWASINLRGQASDQVAFTLSEAADSMPSLGLRGMIVDDLDCEMNPSVLYGLSYLYFSSNRSDVLLVVTSSNVPASEFLFDCELQTNITTILKEFTEKDIKEILEKIGVGKSSIWAKYTHLVSGGGHPQLVIAFIQSMAASGWESSELETLNALLAGLPVLEDVRKRTRERLLRDLPDSARQLIERLSLKVGGFSRKLVIDLANVAPQIQDAGIILDSLNGSWIDQSGGGRFSLSPLLSGYAVKTLNSNTQALILSAIADSLTNDCSLEAIDMNSAILAAWESRNTRVVIKISMAILGASYEELELLVPYLSFFTLFSTDTVAYPSDIVVSHMFRGAQLLLLNQGNDSSSKLKDALRCFRKESENVHSEVRRTLTNLLVYSKLLLQESKVGLGINFISIFSELVNLSQDKNGAFLSKILEDHESSQQKGLTPIGFMFLNQVRQLSKIDEISVVFDFLDSCSVELRSKLLAPYDRDDFEVDVLVAAAWLSEHKKNTIEPLSHSALFARLEKQAVGWSRMDIAVCCRKYQAIILDEYGNDKGSALAILDEGLTIYGQSNSELVRGKAKVLYRSDDHEGSLALSATLIESSAPLNEIEKAYLGRDAAISAEKQGDFVTARRYYLYGRDAANKSKLPNMIAMRVGLLADAALASWHNGDRLICLQDFVTVLKELSRLEPGQTINTTHCHALARHVLLWLDHNVTGETRLLQDGSDVRIYPGCVSNPEPNSEIRNWKHTPIEISWYMLARIENYASLDAGITKRIDQFLPNGPVQEGTMYLSTAKIHKAMTRLDTELFINGLKETITWFAYVQTKGQIADVFDPVKVTYGILPLPNNKQQEKLRDITEQYVLLYFAMYVLKEGGMSINNAIQKITNASGFMVRSKLLECVARRCQVYDFNIGFAQQIFAHVNCNLRGNRATPIQVFELAFGGLQLANITGHNRLFSENLLPWLIKKWEFTRQHQRFLLNYISVHEAKINAVIKKKNVPMHVKSVRLLSAILPALGIENQKQREDVLYKLLKE